MAFLVEMGFDSKRKFTPPTILLGLLLCPWMRDICSQLLQPLPSYCGFSDLGWGYLLKAGPVKHSRHHLYASNLYAKMAYLGVSHYRVRGKWPFSPYQALDFLAAV